MPAPLRPFLIVACLMAVLGLTACQTEATGGAAQGTDDITVTALDAPTGPDATPLAPPPLTDDGAPPARPKPRPDAPPDPAADAATPPDPEAPAQPEAAKSPEQVLCEKTGGQWAVAGLSGAFVCVTMTRDAGKVCRKKTDCEGLCLARSGTCAPIMPLFGCNDVLEKDGRRVTLCID